MITKKEEEAIETLKEDLIDLKAQLLKEISLDDSVDNKKKIRDIRSNIKEKMVTYRMIQEVNLIIGYGSDEDEEEDDPKRVIPETGTRPHKRSMM